MAKATSKKEKTPKPELPTEPIIEATQPEIVPEPEAIAEPIIDEKKELVAPPLPEPKKEELVKEPVTYEPLPPVKEDLSMEKKIEKFLNDRSKGEYIKMNDFLKSLFGVPKGNEPPAWAYQSSSKQLRVLLENMQKMGKLTVKNNFHLKLGTAYYPDDTTLKTHYYSLNTVIIECRG